jgi:photosystem II stability/assembly factor-like uncharacterized protein
VVKTTNGGTTWKKYKDFGGLGEINEVYAVSSSTVWIATDNEIAWSTDGGQNRVHGSDHGLTVCNKPSAILAYMGISAVSDQNAWGSFAFSGGCIAYTADGGDSWTKVEQLDGVDLPGLWTISFAIQPINLDDLITSLIGDVEQLMDDGFPE